LSIKKDILTSDEELLKRSEAGDRLAFEYLYDRYFSKLVWFARGFLKDEESSKDVVQEVFIKLIEKRGLFDPGKKFSTWIYSVTANHCKNRLRNEQNRLRILQEQNRTFNYEEPSTKHDQQLINKGIGEAVESLREKDQQIFRLRFEEEMSIKEIALVMSLPEGSIKSGIFHILKKISKQLKEYTNA
jgi:RNA polymerase sigma-70 factor, ECF subfamily